MPAPFKVIEVINANTIKVSPQWTWREKTGELVKINLSSSYKIIPDVNVFTNRLTRLLKDQYIDLKNPTDNTNDTLACYVFLNGVDISFYFPDVNLKVS